MMDEGGVLVLGTDDVDTARAAAQRHVYDDVDGRYGDGPDGIYDEDERKEVLAMLDGEPRATGYGRCVPTAPGSWERESEGWTWLWYAGHGSPGVRGTTRYVEWYPELRGAPG